MCSELSLEGECKRETLVVSNPANTSARIFLSSPSEEDKVAVSNITGVSAGIVVSGAGLARVRRPPTGLAVVPWTPLVQERKYSGKRQSGTGHLQKYPKMIFSGWKEVTRCLDQSVPWQRAEEYKDNAIDIFT